MGDCHITNGQDNTRFTKLSKFILKHRPEYVVLMGDFLSLESLSAWDKNKRQLMEGRRYNLEIEAGNDALDRLTSSIDMYNKRQRKAKKKQYHPKFVYINGNHEDRLDRYLEGDPTFSGTVSIPKDLKLVERGFEFVPYRSYIYIGGVGFTHVPMNKISAISGVDICRKAQGVTVNSCVFGHTHSLNQANRKIEGMDKLQMILNVGCFFDTDDDPEYSCGRIKDYWRGVVMLDIYDDGVFDTRTTSLERLLC